MYGTHQGEHPYARPLGHCPHARRRRSSASRAEIGDRDRLYGVEAAALSARPYSARHGRAAGVATGRAKIAGETHPSVIGASQATARSPPYPDPKHITLYSQPVEGAIPNRWRANPVIKRPYGPWDQTSFPLLLTYPYSHTVGYRRRDRRGSCTRSVDAPPDTACLTGERGAASGCGRSHRRRCTGCPRIRA